MTQQNETMEAAYHAMRDWLSANAVAGTATVECRDCHAIITIIGDTKAVIAKWNLRAPPAPPAPAEEGAE